jgi:hypothetical protein
MFPFRNMPDASWIDLAGCDLAALLRGIILIGKAKQSRETAAKFINETALSALSGVPYLGQ